MTTTGPNQLIRYLRHTALRQDGAGLTDSELLELYVARGEEAAFEALVRRHGPMVLGVCRRVLRNEADAEDAFQATFLVFVRKAASIRSRNALSSWLYGVAHNTALKAKAMNHKRRVKEREAGITPKAQAHEEVCQELQVLLDAAVSKMPDRYRLPIILCDLEGRTIKEAARQLGWPQGTLATRLRRGRAQLAKRVARHGLALSVGVIVAELSHGEALSRPSSVLIYSTAKAASLIANAGQRAAAGAVSTKVAALTAGMLKSMSLTKLKFGMTLMLALAPVVGGWVAHQTRSAALKGSEEFVKTPGGIPILAAPAKKDVKLDAENDKAMAGAVDDGEKSADHPQGEETSLKARKAENGSEDDLKRKFLIDRAGANARDGAAFRKEGVRPEDIGKGRPSDED